MGVAGRGPRESNPVGAACGAADPPGSLAPLARTRGFEPPSPGEGPGLTLPGELADCSWSGAFHPPPSCQARSWPDPGWQPGLAGESPLRARRPGFLGAPPAPPLRTGGWDLKRNPHDTRYVIRTVVMASTLGGPIVVGVPGVRPRPLWREAKRGPAPRAGSERPVVMTAPRDVSAFGGQFPSSGLG